MSGPVTDTNVACAGLVKSLRLGSYANADGLDDTISAPSLAKFEVGGEFQGVLRVSGAVGTVKVGGGVSGAWAVGSAKSVVVGGNLQDATVELTAPAGGRAPALGKLSVGRDMVNARIHAAAGVGAVTLGAMRNSAIYALPEVPPGELLPPGGVIAAGAAVRSLTIRGSNLTQPVFERSAVAAAVLGRINLGLVRSDNGGEPFGISTDRIATIVFTIPDQRPVKFSGLDDPAAAAFKLQQVEGLGDFMIQLA